MGGHLYRDSGHIFHGATTLKQSFIRLLLALASIFGFDMYPNDVTQACIQSAFKVRQNICIKPDILILSDDEPLQLIQPIYCLSESGDYYHETLRAHQENDLSITSSTGDHSLFFKLISNRLVGLSASYVDDILRAGTHEFNSFSLSSTCGRFSTKESEKTPFEFTYLLESGERNLRLTSHEQYIERLESLTSSVTYEDMRSTRAKLSWVFNTRPDICAAVSHLSQIAEKSFDENIYMLANKVINRLKNTLSLRLCFPKLDLKSVYLLVYSDASANDTSDQRCQIGFIILPMDKFNQCSILR